MTLLEESISAYDDCLVRFNSVRGRMEDPSTIGGKLRIYSIGAIRNEIAHNLRGCMVKLFKYILWCKGFSNHFSLSVGYYIELCNKRGVAISDRMKEFARTADNWLLTGGEDFVTEKEISEGLIVVKELLDIANQMHVIYGDDVSVKEVSTELFR